jgi:hypothetical protein
MNFCREFLDRELRIYSGGVKSSSSENLVGFGCSLGFGGGILTSSFGNCSPHLECMIS